MFSIAQSSEHILGCAQIVGRTSTKPVAGSLAGFGEVPEFKGFS